MGKKTGVGGFLGNIFGGNKKQTQRKEKAVKNDDMEDNKPRQFQRGLKGKQTVAEPKQDVKKGRTKTKGVQQHPKKEQEKDRPKKPQRPKIGNSMLGEEPDREPIKGNIKTTTGGEIQGVPQTAQNTRQPQHDVERKYYPSEQSKEIYGKKTMVQNIFMYSPPSRFLAIQKHINESFEGVVVVGTSNLSKIEDEFSRKINCKHILLFIDTEDDMDGVLGLLESGLKIKSSNPELLHIYIVITDKGVKMSRIKALRDSNLLNLFAINSGIEKLSTGILDQIMVKIVEQQPAYVRPEPMEVPKVAVRTKTLDKELFKLRNMEELKESVAKVRQQSSIKEVGDITNKLTYATSQQDIEDVKGMIPELAVLEEYRESLNEYIEISGGELPTDKLNEILLSKLELTVLQEQVLKDIFGTIINTTNAEEQDEMVRKSNEVLMAEYKPLTESEDLNQLLSSRAELKEKITQGFKRYKEEVQLISNTIETRRYMIQELQQDTLQLTSLGEDVDPGIRQTALALVEKLEDSKLELLEGKSDVEQKLMRTINFTNGLFKDYKVIVSLDEIIIDKLIEDNQRLSTHSVNKVYTVDNPLKAKAKTAYMINANGILPLTRAMFTVDTLIVTDLNIEVGKRLETQSVEKFIEDYTDKSGNLIKLNGNETEEQMDLMIDKLKFLSGHFKKIIFLVSGDTDEVIVDRAMNNSSEIIYLTEPDRTGLLKVNEVRQIEGGKDIFGATVVIDNWDSENEGLPNLGEMRTLGDFKEGVKEIFINTAEAKDREEVKKIILLLRSIL